MTVQVIGCGVGRTGTYSLKLAIERLGLGPCHHMEEVARNQPVQLPLWRAATRGNADWEAIYDGYGSAVDWPTAAFFRELSQAYPQAKFVLTTRDPQRWAESFSETIYKLLGEKEEAPEKMHDWLDTVVEITTKTGFPPGLDMAALQRGFEAHIAAVQTAIPADRLLTYEVKQGWDPLCTFLDKPAPDEPFPRTNDRGEFWDLVASAT